MPHPHESSRSVKSSRRSAGIRPGQAARRRASIGGRPSKTRVSGNGPSLPRRLAARKAPRQDRSRATVEAILAAAVELLAGRGYGRTSTNAIARRAGVSVGSLYQYFPNKDAIVTALLERHMRGIGEIVAAALADMRRPGIPVRDAFRRMLRAFEAFHDADPQMALAVAPEGDGRRELAEIVRKREEHYRQEIAQILDTRPDVRPGDHVLMASLLFDIVDAVTRSLMHGDARRFDRDGAREEAVEAICRYIEKP